MKKVIINEHERGLLFKHGKFQSVLEPGKHRIGFNAVLETVHTDTPIQSKYCSLAGLLENGDFKNAVTVYEIGDGKIGLQYLNGRFSCVVPRGSYAYFNTADSRRVDIFDTTAPDIIGVPESVIAKLPTSCIIKVEVEHYQKALLFVNGKLDRTLDAGVYHFWRGNSKITTQYVDTRLTPLEVSGQEMLTRDKVTLRVNFVCNYRVTDAVKAITEIGNYSYQLYLAAQLALREYVGAHRLDEILESKKAMSDFVFDRLAEKQESFFVEVSDADVKDIILPGEIRDIMNTVLVAEKRAQANVITRREEVASTRSLLNTAKLMEENETLYKLKELEYIERICENVGNININGNGDVITQLATLLHK